MAQKKVHKIVFFLYFLAESLRFSKWREALFSGTTQHKEKWFTILKLAYSQLQNDILLMDVHFLETYFIPWEGY